MSSFTFGPLVRDTAAALATAPEAAESSGLVGPRGHGAGAV